MRIPIIAFMACLVNQLSGMKILIAGEYEKERRGWYESVASKLAKSPKNDNVIYFLSKTLPVGKEV